MQLKLKSSKLFILVLELKDNVGSFLCKMLCSFKMLFNYYSRVCYCILFWADIECIKLHRLPKSEAGHPLPSIWCADNFEERQERQPDTNTICAHPERYSLCRSSHDRVSAGELSAGGWVCGDSGATKTIHGRTECHLSKSQKDMRTLELNSLLIIYTDQSRRLKGLPLVESIFALESQKAEHFGRGGSWMIISFLPHNFCS